MVCQWFECLKFETDLKGDIPGINFISQLGELPSRRQWLGTTMRLLLLLKRKPSSPSRQSSTVTLVTLAAIKPGSAAVLQRSAFRPVSSLHRSSGKPQSLRPSSPPSFRLVLLLQLLLPLMAPLTTQILEAYPSCRLCVPEN